jgi:hypothetical protein
MPSCTRLCQVILFCMDALAWTGAIGGATAAAAGIIAAIGSWRTEVTARWKARAERLRTDEARIENELHRARFTEIWEWVQAQPAGDQQRDAVWWLGQHTGLRYAERVARDGSRSMPALRMTADQAYAQYITALTGHRGRLGMTSPPYLHPRAGGTGAATSGRI